MAVRLYFSPSQLLGRSDRAGLLRIVITDMPLYLDVSPAVHAKAGLSRYADNLAQSLLEQAPDRFFFFFNRSGDSHFPSWLVGQPVRSVRAGYKPWRMMVWLGHLAHIGLDRLVPDCELFHATEHLLVPLRHCPSVLTVHDLIFHLFPERHKRLNRWYLNAALPLYCRRADAIICVSENSRSDLLRTWNIDPNKVHVVYEAADPVFRTASDAEVAAVRTRYGLPLKYLLTVGTIEPRKNLSRLLDALAILIRQGEDINLVIVGRLGWLYHDFLNKLEHFEYRDAVIRPGFVPDSDLPAVYTGATATVTASIYEGFGLPILESMACGTPVISSRTSSLPEFGGEAAHYFDPRDVQEMAAVIGAVWRVAELRRDMQALGREQARCFSWEQAASETMRVYESLGVTIF
jgi:glycosyltransferase involved in cell wall biosynthesis